MELNFLIFPAPERSSDDQKFGPELIWIPIKEDLNLGQTDLAATTKDDTNCKIKFC